MRSVFAGVSYCGCHVSNGILDIVGTYGVTRVDISVITEGSGFLLGTQIVSVVIVCRL